jgi:AcrR family transcriptional regulator
VIPEPEVILPVALAELSHRGYQRTPLSLIARRVGCGLRALSRRYSTKEALSLALLEWRAGHALRAFPEYTRTEPIRERLDRALSALIQFYLDDRGLVAKLTLEIWRALNKKEEEARLRLSWTHAQWQELIREILEDGVRTGAVRLPFDPSTVAASAVAACEGMALRWVVLGGALTPDTFKDSLIDFCVSKPSTLI